VGKQVGEDPDATRANETIGYVVMEAGISMIGDVGVEAGLGTDSIKGVDDSPSYDYTLSGTLPSFSAAVASQAAMDGGNGGWAVLYGSDPASIHDIHLAIDEDQANDSERKHTTEQVAYIVIDPPVEAAPLAANPLDTSGDGLVTSADALLVVNWLNGQQPASAALDQLDVDGDALVTPCDAALLISHLNQQCVSVGAPRQQGSALSAQDVDRLFSATDDDGEELEELLDDDVLEPLAFGWR
jgi:hypothetical protein